ncbi:MAG TPA: response regulator [Tepidisphaeraceae bacterium]|nr:response regulator [Tepidisphaeraceae bacterium]
MIEPAETPYRVLVVDDNPQNVLLIQVQLAAIGCEVEAASDGFQCLAAVDRHPPDLILLDVTMPGMDGFEVCRRLKQHKSYRHIPIVLVTALQAGEDRVVGIEAGCDDFISKPFNRHELMARVKSLLRVKRLEENERLRLRRTLERYVDGRVAEQMLENPELCAPGGRRQDASILFADVRGFTAWSEDQPPEVVIEVINLFLAGCVAAVFRHGGTVDKFMGDGLMALFGAPVPHADHPRRAVATALEIVQTTLKITHPKLGAPLRVGCGVNSGDVIVGHVGSDARIDYTGIGDVTNVASILTKEAQAGQVLVTKKTLERLGPAQAVELGMLQRKNRQGGVHAFIVELLL